MGVRIREVPPYIYIPMKRLFKRKYSTSVSKRSPENIRHGFEPRTQLLDWMEGEREWEGEREGEKRREGERGRKGEREGRKGERREREGTRVRGRYERSRSTNQLPHSP